MRDRARSSLLAVFALAEAAAWFGARFVGGTPVQAKDAARVAASVCEAHELRELQKRDPDVAIEIPKEFDTP